MAGNAIGNSGGRLQARTNCIDETLAAPEPATMSPGALNQEFNGNGGNAGGRLVELRQGADVPTSPSPRTCRGHVFRYVASLVSDNGDIVSFIESNKFVLV